MEIPAKSHTVGYAGTTLPESAQVNLQVGVYMRPVFGDIDNSRPGPDLAELAYSRGV